MDEPFDLSKFLEIAPENLKSKELTEVCDTALEVLPPIEAVEYEKLTVIVNAAMDQLIDRVQYGEKKVNPFTQEVLRLPLTSSALVSAIKLMSERRDITRARLRISGKIDQGQAIMDLLTALQTRAPTQSVIDGELVEQSNHD